MKKILLWSLGIVLVLGLAGLVLIATSLGSIVKAGVNSFGPKLTLTDVNLAGASISPFTGSGTLTGLTVANPPGWKNPQAFSLGKIHLSVAPFSLTGDHIIINELLIDAPEFDYESRLTDSNIAQILANIQKFGGTSAGAGTPTATNGKPVKFEVKKFRLTNAKVSVGLAGVVIPPLPMPDIAMDDLGTKEGGISPDQLVGAVMKNVSAGVIIVGKDAVMNAGTAVIGGVKDATKGATDAAKNAVGGIKDLFGGGKK